ncbi:ATP-binding cassette domain-containing protein [Candidatus Dojkabacteria bacterium]|nr:ATP-binding cassette domain-containing protein [Candidatus Dojkabacteria bacterium]
MKKEQNNSKKEKLSKKLKKLWTGAKWTYKKMFELAPAETSIYIFLAILQAAIPTVRLYFSTRFIDILVTILNGEITSFEEAFQNKSLLTIFIATLALELINPLVHRIQNHLHTKFRIYNIRKLEFELYEKIAQLDVQQFEDKKTSDIIRKAQDNFWKVRDFFKTSVNLILQLVSTMISAAIALQVSVKLSLLIVILSIPNNIFFARFIREWWTFYNSNVENMRKRWWIRGRMTDEKAVPEHKITDGDTYMDTLHRKVGTRLDKTELNIFNKRFRGNLLSAFINLISSVAIQLFLINEIIMGHISLGDFVFFESKFFSFSSELDTLIGSFLDMLDSGTSIQNVKKLFDLKTIIKSGETKLDTTRPPKIEFKNVWFKYPGSTSYVLENVSLTINPGEEIALVGENGAGKTTIVKLILRFYNPTKGQILVDGIPIEDIELKSYYKTISTLFQDYNTYGMLNVKENIRIGDPHEKYSFKKLELAAQKAQADTFINEFDHKYDQILNKRFEKGTNLSKGQWQKIALARMFYRDTPVLIFDEPTSSIDAQAEFEIFKRIYEFVKDKTVIIISHRFSTVRNAQKIYVVDDGKIVESGSHEDLMKLDGKYAESFKLQASGYN